MKALFAGNGGEHIVRLQNYLENKYQGKAVLLYKAREAIFVALQILNLPKGAVVAINGYTCYAVYKAIVDAGYKIEYLDIPKGDLNFSGSTLKAALAKNPAIKIVIIQNTLGFACDMQNIASTCKQNNIVLIEDLAHSVGAVYGDGGEAGRVGDFAVLSFSQDKMIDAVSGGALIIRNKQYQNKTLPEFLEVGKKQQLMDRWYPHLTFKIRTSYAIGLGKITHQIYKSLGVLSKPMGSTENISLHKLPAWYCGLVLRQFNNLQENIFHRREIAKIYASNLNPKILFPALLGLIPDSSNLRFPILVDNRPALVAYLKSFGIHISDIWYDAPIAPEKYMALTDYKHNCPEAEIISKKMLNLPTHINISVKQAEDLAEKINQWLKLQ